MEKLAASEGGELVKCIPEEMADSRRPQPSTGLTAARPPESEIVPFKGFTDNLIPIRFVDSLSDEELNSLNHFLSWKCFVADIHGRRFGNAAWRGKRCEPQVIPDRRIILMNDWFDLSDKHVLELGCFEGIHTIGLAKYARKVTGVDSRIENVVKTIVRCALFGFHPTVFKCDLEARPLDYGPLAADVVHHVGVLYHLRDPVKHLLDLKNFARLGVMVDTHCAEEQEATEVYENAGRQFRYKTYPELDGTDHFSGMYDHAKWLLLEDIVALLKEAGFGHVEIVERRAEPNGLRALLFARKKIGKGRLY
jgi:tRNA (mo5U34)-methyltransferase